MSSLPPARPPRTIYTEEGRYICLTGPNGPIVVRASEIQAVRQRDVANFPCMVYLQGKPGGFYCRNSYQSVMTEWLVLNDETVIGAL